MRLYEITQLLFESRLDYLIKNYSSQVAIQLNKDRTFTVRSTIDNISGTYEENIEAYNHLADKWIAGLIHNDPSNKGIYTQWMIIQYIKGNFIYEDGGNLLDDLTYFHVNKRLFAEKDINQYTVDELYHAVKQIGGQNDTLLTKRQIKAQMKQGAEKILDTKDVLVIHPQTKEAAQYYGSNTRWCTSAINNNEFDHYNEEGPLYIIIDKKTNKKYQIHFETHSLMDELDLVVGIKKFIKKYPEILNIFREKFYEYFPIEALSLRELKSRAEEESNLLLETEAVQIREPLSWVSYGYYINEDSSYWGQSFFDVGSNKIIIIDKQTTDRYSILFKGSQLRHLTDDDNHDNHIKSNTNISKFIENYPDVFDYFKEEFYTYFPIETLSPTEIKDHVEKNTEIIIDTKQYRLISTTTSFAKWYWSQNTTGWTEGNYINTNTKKEFPHKFILFDYRTKKKYLLTVHEVHPWNEDRERILKIYDNDNAFIHRPFQFINSFFPLVSDYLETNYYTLKEN